MNQPQFKATAPYFVVKNLEKSLDYYHRVLGFTMPKLWGEPFSFAMPFRDGFVFMLKQAEPDARLFTNSHKSGFWDAYVWVNDVDSLYATFKEAGAIIEYEPRIQQAYGMKEFAVRDPDGHIIAFGQDWDD